MQNKHCQEVSKTTIPIKPEKRDMLITEYVMSFISSYANIF